MADDKMKKDDQRNMGTGGGDDQDLKQAQQAPGRNPQSGQQSGGQQGGTKKDNLNLDDEKEIGGGTSGQRGGQGQGQGSGGQNRQV